MNLLQSDNRRRPHLGTHLSLLISLSVAAVGLLLFSQCAPLPVAIPTSTPTRTPRIPTPTVTITPSPTSTPAFPVSIGCVQELPDEVCEQFQAIAAQISTHFVWTDDAAQATVVAGREATPGSRRIGLWTYAVAAPFYTVADGLSTGDLQSAWSGTPSGPLIEHALLMSQDTRDILSALWGPTQSESIVTVAASEILTTAQQLNAWAIVPFHALDPKWKVMRVDGLSLLEKGLSQESYPLSFPIYVGSATRAETLALLPLQPTTFVNRDEGSMTIVVMTGVTALTRATAQLMDRMGVTYPARDIKAWFTDADFVHISNEVSFKPDCIAEGSGTMSFCSHDSYIGLLEEIKTNVVELTGNHLEDKGSQWVDHSLEMYRQRGWLWYGGGANQIEAARPITITHAGNHIAFIGCNTVGPFAGEDSGGAAACDFAQVSADLQQLRSAGYLPIMTVQYLEDYSYSPTPAQIRDFRFLAEAGAVVVQGSQAHQAQTMEFHGDTFIHYGLGNFFFDQMWSDGTRQEFVDRLTFYDGRLLSIDLRTAILEEYGRPRPMTVGDPAPEADRSAFLEMIFSVSPQE